MLRRILLTIIAVWFSSSLAWAELSPPPVFVVKANQAAEIPLGPFTGSFPDPKRAVHFPGIRAESFDFNNSAVKHFSYTTARIWTKVRVKNSENYPIERLVEIDLPGLRNFVFYRVASPAVSGDSTILEPMTAEHSLLYRNLVFRLTLPPQAEEEWYMSFENHYSMTIKTLLHEPTAFRQSIEREAIIFSLYVGMMIFAVMFSFFLYTQTHHRPFLFHSLTIASFHLFFFLSNFGVLSPLWALWPWFNERAIFFFIEMSHIFGFFFFMTLSDFHRFLPRTYRWAHIFPIKSFFLLTLSLFSFNAHIVASSVASTALILLFFIGYGTYLTFQGQRSALYFVAGWGVAFVSNIVYATALSFPMSEIPPILDAFLGHQIPLVANIIECIFMSLAIGDQFRQYRGHAQREKENLIRLQKDLEDAEAVQSAFFGTRSTPDVLQIWAASRSAERTGGDWYGYYFDEASQRFYVGIVDVTGHGIRSALVTGAVHGTFYSLVPVLSSQGHSPEERLQCLAQSMNRIVHDTGRTSDLLATMALVEIDLSHQRVYYTGLGHCPSLVLRDDTPKLLHARGSPLGLHEQVTVELKSLLLEEGDIIFLYTDGWLENSKPGSKPLSFKRFSQELARCRTLDELQQTLQTIRSSVLAEVVEDDYTAIAVQFRPSQACRSPESEDLEPPEAYRASS